MVLNIENKSATTYSLSEPRFSIESKKRTKRGLVYEKQIFVPATSAGGLCFKSRAAFRFLQDAGGGFAEVV